MQQKPKSRMEGFDERVKTIVRAITPGKVMTYGEIAKAIGAPTYARQVARVMAHNFDPTVPCHRVIRSDGGLGGYNRGGTVMKRAILLKEGYTFTK